MALYRVEATMTGLQGTPYYSRQHFVNEFAESQADADSAADAVALFWGALASALASPLVVTLSPEVAVLDPATGQQTGSFFHDNGPISMTSAAPELPFATQGLVQLRTGSFVNGRERRGRIFVPGVTEDLSDAGRPTTAWQTQLGAAANNIAANDPALCVYSPQRGAAPVTAATPWGDWATLRSRRD